VDNSALTWDWYPHDHDKHFATNCYVNALYGNCKGVTLQRILSNELIEVTLVSVTLSLCAFWKKVSYEKFHDAAFFCTRNRWWLSPGRYLQECHAPCSSETTCLVFAQLNFEDNSMQHRKRQLSNTVGNHEAQIYEKGISVFGKEECSSFSAIHKYIRNLYIFRRCDQDLLFACPKWRWSGMQIAQVLLQMLMFALQKKIWKRNYN